MSWLLRSPVNLQSLTPMNPLPMASLRAVVLQAHQHRLPDRLLWRLLLGVSLVRLLLVVWQCCNLHFSDMHRNHWRKDMKKTKSYGAIYVDTFYRLIYRLHLSVYKRSNFRYLINHTHILSRRL